MENLNLFNQEMITLGLMRKATPKERRLLKNSGECLTATENKCYEIICSSGIEPINASKIASIFYLESTTNEDDTKNMQVIISRIRKKLGKNEIICRTGFGYVSRRMIIDEMVQKNLKKKG